MVHLRYTHGTLTVHSQYTHGTLTVHSQYTHSTHTLRQYSVMFPYVYLRQFVTVPCLDCEGYRGHCYRNRVKVVWPAGDWNVTVPTGSVWPWHWDLCSVATHCCSVYCTPNVNCYQVLVYYYYYYYYYYYELQFSCHSVTVVLTLVQIKQITINIHKRNDTKSTVQTIQNTVNTSTHSTKTSTHKHAHTLQNKLKQPQCKKHAAELTIWYVQPSVSVYVMS
jgi:hypothetical protein